MFAMMVVKKDKSVNNDQWPSGIVGDPILPYNTLY